MSTELKSHADRVTLTRFFGGSDRATCVQVTVNLGRSFAHVQLTRAQAAALSADLLDFAQARETEVE
jgi:hypothetical protein